MYLDHVKARFYELHIALAEQVQPCTLQEVQALEQQLETQLPKAYCEFLIWMGHEAGPFMRGTDCFYNDLSQLREWAIELLAENSISQTLLDNAFVFCMHQGYQFMLLRMCEGNDPPVYYYNETERRNIFCIIFSSFCAFLLKEIDEHAQLTDS